MSLLFGVAVFFWGMLTFNLLRHLPRLRDLPRDQPKDVQALPGVSVVFSARDEADRIERTVRLLLQHGRPVEEVIAVDDRSVDGTGEILKRIAAEDSRLKALRIEELPEGWLGKTHGLHVGAKHATQPWILFTDADAWIESGTVGRAVEYAIVHSVEHVCLFPSTAPAEKRSFIGDAFVLTFGISLIDVMSRVNTDDPRGAAGVGGFNMLRADLYRSFGGHEQLKLEIADDMMLGVLVRRAGGRTRALMAPDDVECDYASGPLSLLKRLEKNHFAAIRFKTWVAAAIAFIFGYSWLAALIGPFTGNPAGMAAGVALLSTIVPVALFAVRWKLSIFSAVIFPFALPLLGVSMFNSMARTLWHGGVYWRDTFYPLAALRAGCLKWSPLERLTPLDLNSRGGPQQYRRAAGTPPPSDAEPA